MENRVVDKEALIRIAGGHVLASLISRILSNIRQRLTAVLNGRIRRYYSVHTFHAMARLDVPTWEDPVVSEQVDATLPTGRSSIAWTAVNSLVGVGSVLVKLLSQVTVLISVLREQRDGPLLAILCFTEQILMMFKSEPMNFATGGTPRDVLLGLVWAFY